MLERLRDTILNARHGLCLIAATAVLASTTPAPAAEMIERAIATLRGLDKITARTSTFTLRVGDTTAFGSLRVTLRACRENPPIEPPESAAFLEVVEAKPGEQAEPVFSGWMFASSPALSAMEHPVYDVWVISCSDG